MRILRNPPQGGRADRREPGRRGPCVVKCPSCTELASAGPRGIAILLILPILVELGKLFDELTELRGAVSSLKPRNRFRIRSYMIGVVLLAGVLSVSYRDVEPMLALLPPALAMAAEHWLWWHGYRRLAVCLFGVYLMCAIVVAKELQSPVHITALSSSAAAVLGATWTAVLLYIVIGAVRRSVRKRPQNLQGQRKGDSWLR